MGSAYSIHISVEEVGAKSYCTPIYKLHSPAKNADAMEKFADRLGISKENRKRLNGESATTANVEHALKELAQKCVEGDFVFISFSGHGGQAKDLDSCESDGMDEGLLLFDGALIDDKLCQHWANFREGVKIFLLADACHSGTIIKQDEGDTLDLRPCKACDRRPCVKGCNSCCEDGTAVKAAVLSISAVRDSQEAQDGEYYSKFTRAVVDVLDNTELSGTFSDFYGALKRHENTSRFRSPELQELGNCKYYFKSQKMFHF